MQEAVLALLRATETDNCVIGGLAASAHAEPSVSLDLDLAVVSDRITDLAGAARSAGMKVEEHEHSVNLSVAGSDPRVALPRATKTTCFGNWCCVEASGVADRVLNRSERRLHRNGRYQCPATRNWHALACWRGLSYLESSRARRPLL